VSTLLHATVYMFLHNLLNVLVQIASKMGLQKTLFKIIPKLSLYLTNYYVIKAYGKWVHIYIYIYIY
jgi:hypothetical protein